MSVSKMVLLARAFALGALAVGVVAKAPMSEHEHTETAMPQEIGTMTSDGFLIYSMNHCIITQTTNCEVSLSTGPPAVETPGESESASSGALSEGTTVSDVPGGEYPVPTAEPGKPGEPTQPGEPTEGGEPATPTDATGSPSYTDGITASETGEDGPSPTEDDDGATGTETAATGTSTGGSSVVSVFEARVLGMTGLLVAYLL